MCREHVVDVRDEYAKFQEAGGDVAVITMGSVEQVAGFRDRHQLPFVCLADADRRAYQAYKVPIGGVAAVAGPGVWAAGLRATVRAGISKPVGDVRQLHGAFVVAPGGTIRYAHLPASSADRPDHDEIRRVFRDNQAQSATNTN